MLKKKTQIKGTHNFYFVCFFSLSYTFFISRDFVYRGGFLYELIDVQRTIGVTVFTISSWNVMRNMRKNRGKMRKTETRARSRAYMLFHFHYIILTIWDLIQRLQLGRNCDVKFCLYWLPLMHALELDQFNMIRIAPCTGQGWSASYWARRRIFGQCFWTGCSFSTKKLL